ncbi:MAG: hypothetical protein PHX87_03855 [Candidatus Peribacteraceae bacterium]|nr:hypothetical protein [Candidatus Peribacteraceae bacterium]MDD5742538.1 hypothetical protein [Candidatus Peribacteraceae bacterium]
MFLSLLGGTATAHASTVPHSLLYEGRILDASRRPITTSLILRFSLWKDADWTAGDTASGSINIASPMYGGWSEVQAATPTTNGIVNVQLGSTTALPQIDFNQHKYLQVEIKSAAQPDAAFQLLDPTGDAGTDTVDRTSIGSVAYALNAETLQNRSPGTKSGSILLLGSDGKVEIARMGSGTNLPNFTINADQAETDTVLTFGNQAGPETLKFNNTAKRFELSKDLLVSGNIGTTGNISGSGTLKVNGAATLGGTVKLNGVAYTFPTADGTASGRFLATNGAGQLTWTQPFTFARKTNDETVTNSTALQNDNHLFFAVGANQTWIFEMHLVGNSSTSRDFRFAVVAPEDSTCLTSVSDANGSTGGSVISCGAEITKIAGTGEDTPYIVHGLVSTGSTPGTVQLQWAQNSSGSAESILRTNSFLSAERVQ